MNVAATQVSGLDSTRTVLLADGDVLVHEGDEADDVYLLVIGALVATTSSVHGEVVVGRSRPARSSGR